MKLFNTISVEISAACNRSCSFCPVSVARRDEEMMSEVTYSAILGELNALNYSGRLEFYIYNEPLKNKKHFERCAVQAAAMIPRATLMVSSNGDFLKSEKDLEWIYSLGVQQIVLNAYGAKRLPPYLLWEEKLKAKYKNLTDVVYSSIPKSKIALKVYDKVDPLEFGGGVFALQNRAGNIPDFLAPTCEAVPRMCVKPFRLLNINWRGEAMICCNDYYADVPCGRVPDQSLVEIWEGPILSAYRKKLLNKDRSLPLCRTCDCHSGAYPANVDKKQGKQIATDQSIEGLYAARVAERSK